jgi:hypothetical protein
VSEAALIFLLLFKFGDIFVAVNCAHVYNIRLLSTSVGFKVAVGFGKFMV